MASDQTDERRERVRRLWMVRPDRKVAEQLIEEGLGGAVPRTADGKKKQLESMTRNVSNDRKWWRETWRSQKRATSEETSESHGEHLAVLDSLQEIGVEILTDPRMKGTPRVQALMALTRIQEARAKATGVAEVAPTEPDADAQTVPFFGIMVSTEKLSAEAQKKVNEFRKRE